MVFIVKPRIFTCTSQSYCLMDVKLLILFFIDETSCLCQWKKKQNMTQVVGWRAGWDAHDISKSYQWIVNLYNPTICMACLSLLNVIPYFSFTQYSKNKLKVYSSPLRHSKLYMKNYSGFTYIWISCILFKNGNFFDCACKER